jgi:hypothetical protein
VKFALAFASGSRYRMVNDIAESKSSGYRQATLQQSYGRVAGFVREKFAPLLSAVDTGERERSS